jgi:hypothetical protein
MDTAYKLVINDLEDLDSEANKQLQSSQHDNKKIVSVYNKLLGSLGVLLHEVETISPAHDE